MTITTATLTRAAGVAAIAAGLIFVGVQINHPHLDVTSVGTTEWAVRFSLKVLMRRLPSRASPACTCAKSARWGSLDSSATCCSPPATSSS